MDEPRGEKSLPRRSNSPDDGVVTTSVNGCFDCNICLEFAVDPVVSLCGHLYCWPCIYKWLQLVGTSSQQCPVCKAHLSEETLVPLYGRGSLSRKGEQDIPHRPALLRDHSVIASSVLEHRPLVTEGQIHGNFHQYYYGSPGNSLISSPFQTPMLHWNGGNMVSGLATAVVPSMFRNQQEVNLYYGSLSGSGNNLRTRRHQIQVVNTLHQIWVFLLVFAILCFLLF